MYQNGTKVFAKIRGYSYWPGKIIGTREKKMNAASYKVFFYGTNDTALVKESDLKLYNNETLKLHGEYVKKRFNGEFQQGLIDIKNDCSVPFDGDSVSFNCSLIQQQLLIEEKKRLKIMEETDLLDEKIARSKEEAANLTKEIDHLEIKKQKLIIQNRQIEKKNNYKQLKLIKTEPNQVSYIIDSD